MPKSRMSWYIITSLNGLVYTSHLTKEYQMYQKSLKNLQLLKKEKLHPNLSLHEKRKLLDYRHKNQNPRIYWMLNHQ